MVINKHFFMQIKVFGCKIFCFSGIFIRKNFFTNRRRFVKSNVKVYG